MATAVEKLHPFAATKAVGREPWHLPGHIEQDCQRSDCLGGPPRQQGGSSVPEVKVIDGTWCSDPLNREVEASPYGGHNSVIVVPENSPGETADAA